jgi:hypothetical protein
MKRNHKYYPKSYIEEVMKYSRLFAHKSPGLVARNFAIPESTVRGWIRADKSGSTGFILNALTIVVLVILGLAGVVGIAEGVCYLFGGREEAVFLWHTILELVARHSSLL